MSLDSLEDAYLQFSNHDAFEFHLNLADLGIKFLVDQSVQRLPISWGHYLGHSAKERIRVEWMQVDKFESSYTQPQVRKIDGIYFQQRDFVCKYTSENVIRLWTQSGSMDGIFNFTRWLLPRLLEGKRGFILHSSAVAVDDENVVIGLGASGAGKSTFARLSEREILNDDMNLVRIDGEDILVDVLPLGSSESINESTRRPKSFRLKKLFWLQKNNVTEIKRQAPAAQLFQLVQSITNLSWGELEPEVIEEIYEFSRKVISTVPVERLDFVKGKETWSHLQQTI